MTRHIGRSLHNGRSCLAGRQWLSSHLLRGADAVANRLDSWPYEARRLLLFGRQQRGFFMRPGWWRERNRCSGSTVARVGHDCSRVLPISRPGRGARPCACGRCGIRLLLSAGSQRVSAHSPPDCRAGVRRTCLIWRKRALFRKRAHFRKRAPFRKRAFPGHTHRPLSMSVTFA